MFMGMALPAGWKPVLAVALAAHSSLAWAGAKVHITNTSKEPWALRVANGPPATVQIQGQPEAERVDFSLQARRPVYVLAPGGSCTVSFHQRMGDPMGVDIGLIDKAGRDAGTLSVDPQPSRLGQVLSRWFGRGCADASLRPAPPVPPAHAGPWASDDEAWFIHADFWGAPYN